VLTLVLARAVCAGGLADLMPPYKPVDIVTLLQDEKAKKALGIVRYQEPGIKSSLTSYTRSQAQDAGAIYQMKGADREARVRALTARRADELFQSLGRVLSPEQLKRLKQILLQQWGIVLFEFPEIRAALKLSAPEADKLRKIYDDMRNELALKTRDRILTKEEGSKQYQRLSHGIPGPVRAALSEEQRRTIDDLLGAPYPFSP
jgi:hypothetical protein